MARTRRWNVSTWMDRKPIPREEVLKNTLVKDSSLGIFGIPPTDVEEFMRVFMKNIEDYGSADDQRGTKYLRLDKLSAAAPSAAVEELGGEVAGGVAAKYDEKIRAAAPPVTFEPLTVKRIFVAGAWI